MSLLLPRGIAKHLDQFNWGKFGEKSKFLHPYFIVVYLPEQYFILGYSGTVTPNKQIATIPNWGAEYRVTISVFVHSAGSGVSNILRFEGAPNGYGNRNPAIYYYSHGMFHITSALGDNDNDYHNHFNVKRDTWYDIEIVQEMTNSQVRKYR